MILPTPPARLQLQAINKQMLGYPLESAEKDFYLAAALALIAQSHLAAQLVFRGERRCTTAICLSTASRKTSTSPVARQVA